MPDRFDKVAGELALVAVSQVPLAGTIVAIIRAFVPEGADDAFREGVQQELLETVLELQRRIERLAKELEAQGRKIDELTSQHWYNFVREFIRAQAETDTPAKQNALINAAAHRFDPRFGDASAREHWFRRVVALTDIQARLIELLYIHNGLELSVSGKTGATSNIGQGSLPLPDAETVALSAIAAEMAHATTGRLVQTSTSQVSGASHFELTPQGRVLAEFIKNPV